MGYQVPAGLRLSLGWEGDLGVAQTVTGHLAYPYPKSHLQIRFPDELDEILISMLATTYAIVNEIVNLWRRSSKKVSARIVPH